MDELDRLFWGERKGVESNAFLRMRNYSRLVTNVTEDLLIQMERKQLTAAEVARMLGKSRSNVSQMLSGTRNMTLRTISDLAHIVGLQAYVSFSRVPVGRVNRPAVTATSSVSWGQLPRSAARTVKAIGISVPARAA